MRKWIIGIVVVLVLGVYGYQGWVHFSIKESMSLLDRDLDFLTVVPVEQMVLDSGRVCTGLIRELHGISFCLPRLEEQLTTEEMSGDILITYEFEDGALFGLVDFRDTQILLSEYLNIPGNEMTVFNASSFATEYELLSFVFQKTPESVPFWATRQTLIEEYAALEVKQVGLVVGGDLYIGDLKGLDMPAFQYCAPEFCDNTIVQLFTDDGYFNVRFVGFTQEEIDSILHSIQVD